MCSNSISSSISHTIKVDGTEYINWRDTGCELHRHCLDCPEPDCVHDLRGGRATSRKLSQKARAQSLMSREGMTIREVADYLGVSQRTVQRYLERPA